MFVDCKLSTIDFKFVNSKLAWLDTSEEIFFYCLKFIKLFKLAALRTKFYELIKILLKEFVIYEPNSNF